MTEAVESETLVSMSLFGRVYSEVNFDDNFLSLFCNPSRILITLTSFALQLNQLVFMKVYCNMYSELNTLF